MSEYIIEEQKQHERTIHEQRYGYMTSEQAQDHFMKACTCIKKGLFGLAVLHFRRLSCSPLNDCKMTRAKLEEATEKVQHLGIKLTELVENDRLCLKEGRVRKLNRSEQELWILEKKQLAEEVRSVADYAYSGDLEQRKARWLETEDGIRAVIFQDAFKRFWRTLDYPEFKETKHGMGGDGVYKYQGIRDCPVLLGWLIQGGRIYATIRGSELEPKQFAVLHSLQFQVNGQSIYITEEVPGSQRQFEFKVNDQLVVYNKKKRQFELQSESPPNSKATEVEYTDQPCKREGCPRKRITISFFCKWHYLEANERNRVVAQQRKCC